MDRNNVNINSVSQGTRVLSLKDCRKIVKFSSDVFRLYHVYEIKTSGSAPKQTNKQTHTKFYLLFSCLKELFPELRFKHHLKFISLTLEHILYVHARYTTLRIVIL